MLRVGSDLEEIAVQVGPERLESLVGERARLRRQLEEIRKDSLGALDVIARASSPTLTQ